MYLHGGLAQQITGEVRLQLGGIALAFVSTNGTWGGTPYWITASCKDGGGDHAAVAPHVVGLAAAGGVSSAGTL